MRSRAFRFRLIDFEYIAPAILKRYPALYLADTQVGCKPVSYSNMVFDQDEGVINLEVKWSCGVSLEVAPGSVYTFISTHPSM